MRFGWSESEGVEITATTTTQAGTQVVCKDGAGHVITGVLVDVMAGECRGGGLASVRAVWPGRKAASVRMVELADVEVAA
jgi:hypothetical protein